MGGWGSESNREIVSFRVVRASGRGEAACGRETMFLLWLGVSQSESPQRGGSGGVPLLLPVVCWQK